VAGRERRFFTTHREWQWIKHLILGDYLVPWGAKVGYRDRTIFVVDAFAGAGSYVDPSTGARTDGSPVIAARRAQAYAEERPGKELRVICVEKNTANRRALEDRVAAFGDLVTILPGTFAENVAAIAEMIGSAPALVLLDPFGIKGIGAATCQQLLYRTGKTDVFVIAGFSFVHRTGGQLTPMGAPRSDIPAAAANATLVDEFFGSAAWRAIAVSRRPTATRERSYLQLYFDDVLGARFRYKLPYPARRSFDAPPRYWIVHASDFLDAAMLMNNEMVKVDRELFIRTFQTPETLEGMAAAEYDARVRQALINLEEDVLSAIRYAGPGGVTFEALRTSLLNDYFGRVKQGAYANAVRQLVRAEKVLRQKPRWNAKLDEREILRAANKR
jgi:three-Cys-motif partner protein